MRHLFITLSLLSFAGLAGAQDVDPNQLEELRSQAEAEKSRESNIQAEKSKVVKDIATLSKDVKKISSGLATLEKEQNAMIERLSELEAQRAETQTQISQRKSSVSQLLGALQRIENNPPPPLATHPKDAAKAARAGLILKDLTGQFSDRVVFLNASLEEYDQIQKEIQVKQDELTRHQSEMNARREKLQNRVQEKNKLEKSLSADFEAAQKRRLALAKEAQSLQELIDSLERKSRGIVPRIKPDPNAPDSEPETSGGSVASAPMTFTKGDLRFASSKGKLYPVTFGKLTKRYSSSHPGMAIRGGGGAQVFAPASGRVEFAGPFKNYDQVIILNVGDGYYVLLTGLDRLLVQDDSRVSAGDPVGLMPVNSSNDEKLYIELRKNGSTIDPIPWFGTTFAKPSNG